MLVMLCTAARGGMRSVVEAYRRDGVFERHDVELIDTHVEGSAWRRLAVMAGAYARFLRVLMRQQPSAVHAHVAMRGSFWRKSLFLCTAQRFGVPTIAHLHGSEMQRFVESQPAWRRRWIVSQLEAASRVIVLSESWARFVSTLAPRARVEVVPNYVTVPPARAYEPDAGTLRVVFLGLVGRRKGVYELLPALSRALQRAPALRLDVAGNGEVDQARAAADAMGLGDRVRFVGWIDAAARHELLQAAHVYVLPSHNEGLPMSVLEAMSYGLPVITTKVGGLPELITHGQDGWLIDAGDVGQLEQALVTLAQEPELRQRIGAAARRRVAAQYSREAVLPKLEAIYTSVAGDVRPGAERAGGKPV